MNPPQSLFSPPAQQPMKKQRATATPDRVSLQADDAISRRKAELARLQQQLPGNRTNENAQSDLLARARMTLSSASMGMPSGPRPPPMPGQQPMIGPRTSDLYPEAPKTAVRPGPPPEGPSSSPPGTTPDTAKVVRRLDVSFASNRKSVSPTSTTRSKSAPPQRPPPPGPPPTSHSEDPENSLPPPPPPTAPASVAQPAQARPPPPPPAGPKSGPPPKQAQQPPPPPPPAAPTVSFAPEVMPELVVEEDLMSPPVQGREKSSSSMDIDFGSDSHDNDYFATGTAENEEAPPPPMQTPDVEVFKPAKRRNTPFARSKVDLDEEDDDEMGGVGSDHMESNTPSTIDLLRRDTDNHQQPRSTIFTGSASNMTPSEASIDLRLAKELTMAQQEKAEALERIAELETKIMEMQQAEAMVSNQSDVGRGSDGKNLFGVFFEKIQQQGMDAALDWARHQAEQLDSNGSIDNMNATKQSITRKISLPRPKQAHSLDLELEWLAETVKQLPYEYVDEDLQVSYFVRRPYGIEDNRELWLSAGQLPSKGYANKASVTDCQSVEVVARIPFDGSNMALFGESRVRYQSPVGDWEDFGNVFERNDALGSILYIDPSDGTQKMYSLDQILEGALAVRQYYCHSIISAAAGLKRGKSLSDVVTAPESASGTLASPGKDVGVDTGDLPKPKKLTEEQPKQAPPASAEEGSDVITLFFNMLISGIFGLLWNIFVLLPLRILFNTIALATAFGILTLAWVYYEYDSGAAHWGSSVELMFNQPGIL